MLKRLGDRAELRRYESFIVAETTVPSGPDAGGMRGAMNGGFRSVAGYIFGGNSKAGTSSSESVAMTSPVRAEPVQLSMTAPVRAVPGGAAGAESYKVSFVMPRKYTLATLPTPKDPRVQLREEPPHLAAALAFRRAARNHRPALPAPSVRGSDWARADPSRSGSPDEGEWQRRQRELEAILTAEGLQPEPGAAPLYYQYYPPFVPAWMRLCEVLLRVQAPPA